jgi:hypothetical protein
MSAKKIIAWGVMAVAAPLLLDCAVDPYADRSMIRSWAYGAAGIGGIAVILWAADETGMRDSPIVEALTENG